MLTVLTDGLDNCSTHTREEVMQLVAAHPNVTLSIVHVGAGGVPCAAYMEAAARGHGLYAQAESPAELETTFTRVVQETYTVTRAVRA